MSRLSVCFCWEQQFINGALIYVNKNWKSAFLCLDFKVIDVQTYPVKLYNFSPLYYTLFEVSTKVYAEILWNTLRKYSQHSVISTKILFCAKESYDSSKVCLSWSQAFLFWQESKSVSTKVKLKLWSSAFILDTFGESGHQERQKRSPTIAAISLRRCLLRIDSEFDSEFMFGRKPLRGAFICHMTWYHAKYHFVLSYFIALSNIILCYLALLHFHFSLALLQ